MASDAWISSLEDFDLARRELRRTFALENLLPDRVFLDSIATFAFIEFDIILSAAFWPFLRDRARTTASDSLYFLMTDPPAKEYFEYHQRFGALRFPASSSAEDYFCSLFESPDSGSEPDALGHLSRSVAIADGTGVWGVWGDRSLGIAAFGTSKSEGVRFAPESNWLNLNEAIDVISMSFRNRVVPPAFVRRFRQAFAGVEA